MSEKPVMRILPRWDPDEPRFIVDTCGKCSDDRQFKNGKVVFNQRLGFAYSVDEIVEVLNNKDVEDDFNQSECITVYDLKQEIKKLKKENEQLKQEVIRWKIILDDYQQIVVKTLRKEYHWLKNEDKILNNDKTVALLELESIATRLGVDLK